MYKYNDDWADKQFSIYVDTRDMLQDVLDKQVSVGMSADTAKGDSLDVDFAVNEIKSEFQTIQSSVSKIKSEIEGYEDQKMPVHTVKGYEGLLDKLCVQIETGLRQKVLTKLASNTLSTDIEYSNEKLRNKFKTFHENTTADLYACRLLLVKKTLSVTTVEAKTSSTLDTSMHADMDYLSLGHRPREQVFLEKSKPPRFTGDDLDFA